MSYPSDPIKHITKLVEERISLLRNELADKNAELENLSAGLALLVDPGSATWGKRAGLVSSPPHMPTSSRTPQ